MEELRLGSGILWGDHCVAVLSGLLLFACWTSSPSSPEVSLTPVPVASATPVEGSFRQAITKVAGRCLGSVVSIRTERKTEPATAPFGPQFGNPFEFFFGRERRGPGLARPQPRRHASLGSGFVATAQGHIVTNAHVVVGAERLRVQLADEREVEAHLVGMDEPTDIAVIQIDASDATDLKPLPLGDSSALQVGNWVVAVGAPFGLQQTVTAGIISAKGRRDLDVSSYGNYLQTDAAINPGNSGGPLVSLHGQVVGMNTAIVTRSGGNQGIGFAIPSNLLRQILEQLIKNGEVTRGWLGISIQSISEDLAKALQLNNRRGALVAEVVPGGPAEAAGFQGGDTVVEVAAKPIVDSNDLLNRIALIAPGTNVKVVVTRDSKRVTLEVTVGRRQAISAASDHKRSRKNRTLKSLGVQVAPLTISLRQQYQVADHVKQGSVIVDLRANAAPGLQVGDVILQVNRQPITSTKDFSQLLRDLPAGKPLALLLHRRGRTFYHVVRSAE